MSRKWFFTILLAAGLNAHAGPDFKTASGTVLIAAPTALNGPSAQGIWFINPMNRMISLSLPELPVNQVYEGWVVNQMTGMKVSTGLFRHNGMTDSDAAGAYKGPLALDFPALPGSDFVTLGSDLTDGNHVIVITVEPYPDSDPNPSGVGILKTAIPMGTMPRTQLTLQNIAN